ncbi:MAG: hypothetical protein ACJZ86_05515 [Pontiellaceae bacterium]
MKKILHTCFILLLCIKSVTAHLFSLPDGRTIEATIRSFDDHSGLVELERLNGKVVKIKPNVFIEKDQRYIQMWSVERLFLSSLHLQIEVDDVVLDNWKEEEYIDLTYTSGNTERELMKETKFEEIAFEVILKNRSAEPFEDLYIEYVIFYEQSQESFGKPTLKQLTKRDKLEIQRIDGKSTLVKKTDDVTVHKDNIMSKNWSSGESRTGGKGEVHGLRARLCKKMLDGSVIYREFTSPKSFSETRYPWPD